MPRKKSKKRKDIVELPVLPEVEDGEYEFISPQKEVDFQSAPLWKRAVAYLIDLAFFYFLFFQVFVLVYFPRIGVDITNSSAFERYIEYYPGGMGKVIAGIVVALFILLAYFALFERNFGTTVGKKLMKIKLKKTPSYYEAFIRNLTKSIFIFLLPIDLIGLFFGKRFSEIPFHNRVVYLSNLYVEYGGWY